MLSDECRLGNDDTVLVRSTGFFYRNLFELGFPPKEYGRCVLKSYGISSEFERMCNIANMLVPSGFQATIIMDARVGEAEAVLRALVAAYPGGSGDVVATEEQPCLTRYCPR